MSSDGKDRVEDHNEQSCIRKQTPPKLQIHCSGLWKVNAPLWWTNSEELFHSEHSFLKRDTFVTGVFCQWVKTSSPWVLLVDM